MNIFSVIEVWNFLDANNDDNDLVGVVMVPLHQFYTSFKVCVCKNKHSLCRNEYQNFFRFKAGVESPLTPTCL